VPAPDVLGARCNRGEASIGPNNAGELREKWRFPAQGTGQEIGVIHATPVVVNGYVYFGTATDPTFYKLTPDGRVEVRTPDDFPFIQKGTPPDYVPPDKPKFLPTD